MVKPSKFEIAVEVTGSEGRVAVAGDLDMSTSPRLSASVKTALQRGARRIVVDLHNVGFVDSSGLRTLIELHRRGADEGWRLAIRPPSEDAFTVFRISGADQALPFTEA
jgi:anti-sigma B factor antagonist